MSPARTPGRPTRQGPDLREALLDAAVAEFVGSGIVASTLRGIAKRAGATPALLHYYFSDKDGLVEALIAERLLPIAGELRATLGSDPQPTSPRELTRGFVTTAFGLFERHPWLPPLWQREVLAEGGALRERLLPRMAALLPQAMAQRFAAARAAGELDARLDPRLLVVSLIGLTLFVAAAAPVWRQVFGAGDIGREQLVEHTLALLERGLEPPDAR
jgi:TetR/AcrR family transcriptional regulator